MIGWLLLIGLFLLFLFVGVYNIKYLDKTDDETRLSIIVIGLGVIFLISGSGLAFYRAKIYMPEEYITINRKIEKVEAIITNKELNLADIEMNKSLAELIIEKEDLFMRVRINNKSPFALFKISLDN